MTHETMSRNEGFTLVEVLLALAIAAILFAGVFVALDQALQSRNSMSNRATPYTIGPAILDRIAADLSNAYFYDIKNNNAFYAVDHEFSGHEADGMSFLTTQKTYMPEQYRTKDDMRHSFLNEVAYLMRRGDAGSTFMQLWRREDFFVDDYPHAGGDYVLLYDKVKSFKIQYVSRNPETRGGVAGPAKKETEDMLQDGWNAVEELGVPRALQVVVEIYAPDDYRDTWEKAASGEARAYLFKRFIALPQVHVSRESEQAVASWDGTLNEATGVTTGRNVRNPGGNVTTGAGARGRGGRDGTNATAGAQRRGGRRGQGNNRRPNQGAAGNNPFLNALRNAGRRPSGGGGSNPFSGIFR